MSVCYLCCQNLFPYLKNQIQTLFVILEDCQTYCQYHNPLNTLQKNCSWYKKTKQFTDLDPSQHENIKHLEKIGN